MGDKNMYVISQVVELSETDSYIDLLDRVCYYDNPNLNNVQLDYDETSYEKAQTLVNQPVLAYYKTDINGNPTLGGHEVRRNNGKISFATQAIGTHLDARIEDAEVELVNGETKTVKCLFSTIRLWKRFENCVSAARSLFESGKLYNSWEIMSSGAFYEGNIRHLKEYEFIGNCLLGTSYPAYGKASHVYETAALDEEDPQLLIAEALSADLVGCNNCENNDGSDSASNINNQLDNQFENSESDRKEMTPKMEANENIVVENSEVSAEEETVETVEPADVENAEASEQVEETVEANAEENVNNEEAEVSEEHPASDKAEAEAQQTENSEGNADPEKVEPENTEAETQEVGEMKTDSDISKMVWKAVDSVRDENGDWYYVSMLFPEDHIVLVQSYNMPSLNYIQYSYRIDGDKAVLENRKEVQMKISPLSINSEIESKNSAIADANNRIVELENQNAELVKVKEELDKIKKDQEEAEHAEAVNRLREYVVKSGRFTEEEIASEEIQNAINGLNEAWIKAEIADRLVASMMANNAGNNNGMETSEAGGNMLSVVLSESSEDKPASKEDVMRAFFNRD